MTSTGKSCAQSCSGARTARSPCYASISKPARRRCARSACTSCCPRDVAKSSGVGAGGCAALVRMLPSRQRTVLLLHGILDLVAGLFHLFADILRRVIDFLPSFFGRTFLAGSQASSCENQNQCACQRRVELHRRFPLVIVSQTFSPPFMRRRLDRVTAIGVCLCHCANRHPLPSIGSNVVRNRCSRM